MWTRCCLCVDEQSCNVNPCERYGYCSQRCTWDGDTERFTCTCDSDYRLEQHGRNSLKSCVAAGAAATLLVAEQNQLRSLDPYHRRGEYRQLMELKDDRINFVDVNFRNPSDATLYWSSRENHVIYKQTLPKKRKERGDFDRSQPIPLVRHFQDIALLDIWQTRQTNSTRCIHQLITLETCAT